MSSYGLSVGIVGLPNVGKSTLFNALLKKQQAYVANFPFATIEPNVGIVPVPDSRLEKLAETIKASENMATLPPIVNATVEFVDIAGLIAGAHKGEGLGNKFLSHIREVDAICHVVRVFSDGDIVKEGSVSPKDDFEIIKTELELADLEMVEKHQKKKNANVEILPLLAKKPFLVVLNVAEHDLAKVSKLEEQYAKEFGVDQNQVIAICAKTESQLVDLPSGDQADYLASLGIEKSGLERLIQKAFKTLGLATFLTAGAKEVRAWTIKDGIKASAAAGVIHTDFEKKFIRADVVAFNDFVSLGGWKPARENGKARSEGKDYQVTEGDVIEFKIGS
ncbi:MAG: redox-regulated ATPase YchF [Patescibacteria group bacterium]